MPACSFVRILRRELGMGIPSIFNFCKPPKEGQMTPGDWVGIAALVLALGVTCWLGWKWSGDE